MMVTRKKLILGNWKLHGSYDFNSELLGAVSTWHTSPKQVDVGVCVPAVYLSHVEDLLYDKAVFYGAQDCSAYSNGAYTGDISAAMIAEFGAHYVLVGHSERRQYQQESSQAVALKAQQALSAGLTPVVCIGETLAQREAGETLAILTEQLEAVMMTLGSDGISRCVIAYEPVWAIGTGKTATPQQAQEIHAQLRAWLLAKGAAAGTMRLIYGGSMKPDNAGVLLSQVDIDGGLIGGAALKAADFMAIVTAALAIQAN